MLSRALAPLVLCASATWPLLALACINSMDESAEAFNQPLWLDLLFWTGGAVLLNFVVLGNLREPSAKAQPTPSRFRQPFFLIAGTCLVLLVAILLAGGPLLSLSEVDMARCSMSRSRSMLLMLVAGPAVLFVLQAVLFQGAGKRWLVHKRGPALGTLVFTSVLLAVVVNVARDVHVIPQLCRVPIYY